MGFIPLSAIRIITQILLFVNRSSENRSGREVFFRERGQGEDGVHEDYTGGYDSGTAKARFDGSAAYAVQYSPRGLHLPQGQEDSCRVRKDSG